MAPGVYNPAFCAIIGGTILPPAENAVNPLQEFLKRHALPIGICLMFLFTWPIEFSGAGVLPIRFPDFVYVFMGWGFVMASLLMTRLTLGTQGVDGLLRRFLIWRVGWKWYLALLIIPAIDLGAIGLHAAINHVTPDLRSTGAFAIFGSSPTMLMLVIPILLVEGFLNGEEIGWRGYVLPRLQARYDALYSALVVGLIWAVWHIPRFIGFLDTMAMSWYLLGVLAKSVFITWIYNGTRGSLLLATLCHSLWNTAGFYLPLTTTVSAADIGLFPIVITLELSVAVIISILAGPRLLSRTEPKQVQIMPGQTSEVPTTDLWRHG
jgi:membrane protease YdiL (CAAX protease family)